MPGAPAATHAATASSTSGSLPPLELRSVATLLTLTDSFIDGIDNLLRPSIDLLQVLPLEHHAEERFRSRVTDEQPAVASKPLFDPLHDGDDLGNLNEICFFTYAYVQQHLRVRREFVGEIRQLSSARGHCAKHAEGGDKAISSEQVLGKNEVAGLFSAKRQIPLLHLLHDVLVADLRADQLDAELLQRDLQPDVAHDGRDDGVAAQPALGL